MTDKKSIRKELLTKRRSISEYDRKEADDQIFAKLLPVLREKRQSNPGTLFLYVNNKEEVDTRRLLNHCFESEIPVAVPKVSGKHKMDFFKIHDISDLQEGYAGILEPVADEKNKVEGKGIMIVPGVGFSYDKYRLGYGGGFYDCYFERYKGNFYKIALAYECQMVHELPVEPTDYPVDMIITEENIYE